MPNKSKLKMRRRVRKTTKDAVKAGDQVGEQFEKHVTSRWENLRQVQRFVTTWLILVMLLGLGVIIQTGNLGATYETEAPADGGVFIEGVVGEVNNLNPIFANTSADNTASKLIFNGLLRYSDETELVGDLATDWEVDEEGTTYTVYLRQDVQWHDGTPFTASDVVFTIDSIKHPDVRSPLNSSWQDVVAQALDEHTVTFTLPNPFTPFVHSLTLGILPAHVLAEVPPLELRAHPFNLQPTVGTGPFIYEQLEVNESISEIELVANENYYLSSPRLDGFIIRTFTDHEEMIEAFQNDELTSMAGLRTFDNEVLGDLNELDYYDLPLFNSVFLFMNNSDEQLKDKALRRALTRATNRQAIFNLLNNRYAIGQGPLLPSQTGYDSEVVQFRFNPKAANNILDGAGWEFAEDGYRVDKDGNVLELSLVTQSTDEFPELVEELQRQWKEVGIRLTAQLVSPRDLQQSHIVPHNYQILLANVSLGVDPDVFVYWHSSQAEVRGFNFSEYKNDEVDAALEAGRTREDDELRIAKYRAFLEQWVSDAPAVSLYQPGFSYVQDKSVQGFEGGRVVSPVDRLNSVQNWTVNTVTVAN